MILGYDKALRTSSVDGTVRSTVTLRPLLLHWMRRREGRYVRSTDNLQPLILGCTIGGAVGYTYIDVGDGALVLGE